MNPNDLLKMFPDTSKLKNQIENSLKQKTIKVTSKDGKVTISINGWQEIKSVSIDKTLLAASKAAQLKQDIIEAANKAIKASRDSMLQEAFKSLPNFRT